MATLLLITVLLPLLGGLVLAFWPADDYRSARWVALVTTLVTLGMSLVLAWNFDKDAAATYQFTVLDGEHIGYEWLFLGPGPGIRFSLGLDGISLTLFVLTALLMVPSVFSSWESVKERAPMHYALMLALATGMLGLFASLDVILFYIFFEFTLIPLFFLIGIYGGPERRRASIYFFLYTLAGSLLTLIGVIVLVLIHREFSPAHVLTFSIPELTEGLAALPWDRWAYNPDVSWTASPQALIFLLLFAGFAVKVPLFPFHTWLPLAHVEAPTAGSILLAGVLLKVGGYGFLRFNLGMTPDGAYYLLPFLAAISIAGIIYGALTALAQSDVKRLVAYSSVSHMGFIALGLFTLTWEGLDGAVIQMINHGLTTGALFACVGVFYERYHTREMAELGGIWQRLPLLAFFMILSSLGSMAVPGLNGFVGEFPILVGAFSREPLYAVLSTIGIVLGAYYLLVMLRRVVFGPLREPHQDHQHGHENSAETHEPQHPVRPVGWHEIAGLAPLMVLIVAIGVYPGPIFERISPAVEPYVARFYVEPISTGSPPVATTRTPRQPNSDHPGPSQPDIDSTRPVPAKRSGTVVAQNVEMDQDRPR